MAKQSNPDKKKLTREQRDNQILRRVFYMFLVGIAAECYLLFINNRFVSADAVRLVAMYDGFLVAGIVGLIVMALGIVLMLLKKGGDKLRRAYPWIAGLGAFFGFTSLALRGFYPMGGSYLCVLIPILTVLGLVYFLFQREFFVITIILGGALFTVWVCRKGLGTVNWNTLAIAGSVLVLIGLACVALLTRMIQKLGGKWPGKGKARIFPANCDYRMLYAAYALAFAAILLALLVVSTTYYSLWALGILLFAFAVYYTTKLM